MRSLIELLADARDHARRAAGYVSGVSPSAFTADAMRREAVCFCLTVVGEACSEAAKHLQKLPAEIPWGEIKGMRNILIHEYWQIDHAVVYDVARNEAELLAAQLDNVIKQLA
jgi:uncharacterized protein with HEPN domain